MFVHQRTGVDVIRQFYTQGLLACEPSLQTGRMSAPAAWNGVTFIVPDAIDAGRTYRQSHERGLYP